MIRACHLTPSFATSRSSSLLQMLGALKYFIGISLLKLKLSTESSLAKESAFAF